MMAPGSPSGDVMISTTASNVKTSMSNGETKQSPDDNDDVISTMSDSEIVGSAMSMRADTSRGAPEEDNGSDTDLEIEDEKTEYFVSGPKVYLETCQELGVVPASYFVRHIQDETVIMCHHGLGPVGAKAVAIPLVTNTTVTVLDLRDNFVQAEGAKHIAEMLKENCYITHLNLSDNKLGHVGAMAMCDMLLQNTSITSLNLAGNGFTDKDAPHFAEALLMNGRVSELDLSRNDFGMGAGASLGHAIGENETLEVLDLSWNHFRAKSGIDIVDGVKVNSLLKRVNLSWNGLGDDGAAAVADCIKFNHVMKSFDVSNCRISGEKIPQIAKALDINEDLVELKIGQNPIGAPGALLMLQAINNERSLLESLDITDICVDKEFITLHEEILQSRQLTIHHGGVLSSFGRQPKPKKPKGNELDPEELAAFRALEDFLQNDPMALLQAHVKRKNLRLVDLFREFDKDKDYKISPEDMKRGVKHAGLDMTNDKIDELVDRLDKGKDGRVDYRNYIPNDEQY